MVFSFIFCILLISLVLVWAEEGEGAQCVKGKPVLDDFDGSGWPDLWRLTDDEPEDPMAANRGETVEPRVMSGAGVEYIPEMDPSQFDYPTSEKPFEGEEDQAVLQIREDRNYTYADVITVTSLVPSFWEEHHHGDETIRYILNGSGYFDLRDLDDQWVRMHVKPGDFMIWPKGINHRFVIDENSTITAMRLFRGDPVWTAYPRSDVHGNHSARNNYVEEYLCGDDPDMEDGGEDGDTPTQNTSGAWMPGYGPLLLLLHHSILLYPLL
ncbi:hypothetical protein ACHAWF_008336 [Thalassiosira exigua]